MRERLITLACALGALLVFATLFMRPEPGDARHAALPTTIETHDNGLRAAFEWLSAEGVHVISVRERFDLIAHRPGMVASGNLLIMSMPLATPIRAQEARALDQWIRAGNTLLVLAALSDHPAWSIGGIGAHNDLQLLTGLDFDAVHTDDTKQSAMARAIEAARDLKPPQRSTLVPIGNHPLLRGVHEAAAFSDRLPQRWSVHEPRDGFVLALARSRESGDDMLWARPRGSGTLIVSGFASLFSNRALRLPDNAQLLSSIIAVTLEPDGSVLFDDEHQGLTSAYDPAKFYADPRLYRTIAVLAAVWLVWVLGGTRLRLPTMRTLAPREEQLVSATGHFLARVLRPAAAARRMFEHFFRRLGSRSHRTVTDAEPQWQWLEQHPRLKGRDIQQLKEWYAHAYAGQRVPLVRLHNLLVSIERQLSA